MPVSFPKSLKTISKFGIDSRPACGYNTPSVIQSCGRHDAYRLYPPEAEGHWRTA
jgi:hypothetical protein